MAKDANVKNVDSGARSVFKTGFLVIGAMIIIMTGIDLSFGYALTAACDMNCASGNLAMVLGGVVLFIALLNYVQPNKEILTGVLCMALSVILLISNYVGGFGSRPLLVGAAFVFVGGIFSIIASRR